MRNKDEGGSRKCQVIVCDFVRNGKFDFAEISDEKSETPSDTPKIQFCGRD